MSISRVGPILLAILAAMLIGLNTLWGVSLEIARILAFLVALALAVGLNFLIYYCIGAVSFWVVEVGFLFAGIRITFILLSGGIFPLDVFGETFVRVLRLLPFPYTVFFPINVLNGRLGVEEILVGILVQCAWIGLMLLLAGALWRAGGQRYVAVGG